MKRIILLVFLVCMISGCGGYTDGIADVKDESSTVATQLPANEAQASTETSISTEAQATTEAQVTTEAPTATETSTEASTSREASTEASISALPAPTKETPAPTKEKPVEQASIVTISIVGDEKKGIILTPTEVEWKDGEDVLDVLKKVTKSNRIPMESRGSGMLSYVEGIANLYEFDQGPGSGWLFKINGEYAGKSAGAAKLNKGDFIEWIYSIELKEEPLS